MAGELRVKNLIIEDLQNTIFTGVDQNGRFIASSSLGNNKIGNSNVKFHGVNLTPDNYFHVAYWPIFWMDFINKPLFFENAVKPFVDEAKNLGFNTIRCATAVGGIVSGLYTRSQLHTAYAQLIDYCASKDLYFYATSHGWGSPALILTQINNELVTEIVELHKMLNSKRNVIGVDHCNEINNLFGQVTSTQAVTFAQTVSTAINALGLPLPYGFSLTTAGMGIVNSFDVGDSEAETISNLGSICIRHIYTDPDPTDIYNLSKYNKPLFFGEYGVVTANPAQRISRLNSTMGHMANDLTAGGCFFALSKYSATEPYEIINETGILQSDTIDILRRYIKSNFNRYRKFDTIARFNGVNGTLITSFTFQKGSLLSQTGTPALQGNTLRLSSGNNIEISTVKDSVTTVTVNSMSSSSGDLRVSQFNGVTEISAIYMVLSGQTLFYALVDPLVGNVAVGNFLVSFPFTFRFYQSFDTVKFSPEGYVGVQGTIPTTTVDRVRVSSGTGNTDIKLITIQTKAF